MMFLAKNLKKSCVPINNGNPQDSVRAQAYTTCLCSPCTPPPASKHTNPSAGASRSACPTKPYIIIIMSLTIAFDVSTPPRTPRRGAHSQIGWLCEPLNYEVSFLSLEGKSNLLTEHVRLRWFILCTDLRTEKDVLRLLYPIRL